MEPKALKRLELFAENTEALRGAFQWQNAMLRRLAAFLHAAEDRAVDLTAMKECHGLIKRSTGAFSFFRGNCAIILTALLALSDHSDALLNGALGAYDRLKRARFPASDYLVIAACQIASNVGEDGYAVAVERARAFYDGMKADHPFLTGQDDHILSAMLGLSTLEVAGGLERMERLFQTFRPEFRTGVGVQALSQVLVLGNDAGAETRVWNLYDALRGRGMKQLCQAYALSSLGVLALLPMDPAEIADQIAETSQLLRTKKGFGPWAGVVKQELLLLSAALVALNAADRAHWGVLDASLSTSVMNIIIAQQAIFAAAAAASAGGS